MDKLSQINKRFDRLWAEAEKFVVAFFDANKAVETDDKGRKRTVYKLPDLRQLSYVVSCLKRIQEGRRLANLGVQASADESETNNQNLAAVHQEISRILGQLQEDKANKETTED